MCSFSLKQKQLQHIKECEPLLCPGFVIFKNKAKTGKCLKILMKSDVMM